MKTLKEIKEEIAQAKFPVYIYVLHKPDGTPFYVGKGGHRRIEAHEKEAKKEHYWLGKNTLKTGTIQKIWREGGQIFYSIDTWHTESLSAHSREIELIASFGRKILGLGPLTNITAGGEGCTDLPQEIRDKIAAKLRQMYVDNPHLREEIAAKLRQMYVDNPHLREESAARMLKLYEDRPELKEQISESVIAYCLDHPEFIENLQSKKDEWIENCPEEYAEAERKRLEICATPEVRQAVSETLKEYFKDPEILEKMSERAKKWHQEHPEFVEINRQQAIDNNACQHIIKWLETVSDEEWDAKQKQHSEFMTAWHASEQGKEKTKEAAIKRNAKIRTAGHRQHMAKKTAEYIAANPEADKARRAKVAATVKPRIEARQKALQAIQERLLAEGRLWVRQEFIDPRMWYAWKKRGIVLPEELAQMEEHEQERS